MGLQSRLECSTGGAATADKNVEVSNDTLDLYRYFDATDAAEFLYTCVKRTIEHDLPKEISCLLAHDVAMEEIMKIVEMPDRLAGNLIYFVRQNDGSLSNKRRKKEFSALTDKEVRTVEEIIQQAFKKYAAGFNHEQ